ncbi:endonuclease [Flavobacteriaceae bacterium F08102]|nr:endonuclease [Flavobacteriaceae bacterium F08102]
MKALLSSKELYTAAFYNLENLFDVRDDADTLDEDFSPKGKKKWTKKRYYAKINRLTSVMVQIGVEKVGYVPAFIGIGEVENEAVVKDLINSKHLRPYNFGYIHTNSSDERGIEVAFLYRKSIFELLDSNAHPLFLKDGHGRRDFTRDVLHVQGKLAGNTIHVLVNHWPSRRTGSGFTDEKRVAAADLVRSIIENIKRDNSEAQIIVMGDFNDEPYSNSIQRLKHDDLFNPYEIIKNRGQGTSTHARQWFLFDQIIMSQNFQADFPIRFVEAAIFNKNFLTEYKGKRKGNPFRTYLGRKHQGGYSDHFPVYTVLESV